MNCYIETLSLMRTVFPPMNFRMASTGMCPQGAEARSFPGQQTNEPQTKYYIWKLAQSNQVLDRILVLVTKECMEQPIEVVGNLTTYEFYVEAIRCYLEELAKENIFFGKWLSETYAGDTSAYLKNTLKPVMVPERMDSAEWRRIVSMITEKDAEEKLELYFDFTGGSRVASLISLLLLRIIEEANHAVVKQVIYSDVQNRDDPKLVDCTRNYAILTSLERIAVANTAGEKATRKIVDELVKMGLSDESELTGTEAIDRVQQNADCALRKREREAVREDLSAAERSIKDSSGLAKGFKNNAIQKAKTVNSESPFRSLSKRKDLILVFHEEIMGILLDLQIVHSKLRKDRLVELMKANSDYSEDLWRWNRFNPKTRKYDIGESALVGVYPQLKKWLKLLAAQPSQSAWDVIEQQTDVRLPEYARIVDNRRFLNSATKKHTADFVKYLKEKEIASADYAYEQLAGMERVYLNLGFPFPCCYRGELYYEISNYYLDRTVALFDELEQIRQKDVNAYQERMAKLQSVPGELERAVPFMMKMKQWSWSQEKFSSPEAAERFAKELFERIEEVRRYRNAIAHKLENKYSDPVLQEELAKKIRIWLQEYEERFPQ